MAGGQALANLGEFRRGALHVCLSELPVGFVWLMINHPG